MKRVSVIIVNWNGCALLRKCLNSIREAGGPLVGEVIVIDNASSDGSAEMVAVEFPEVTLVRSEQNLGFARANNLGLEQASGSWLALINSDVVVHPDCFDRLAHYLEEHDRVGLVGPKVFGRDGQQQRTCRKFPTMWNTLCRSLALDLVFPKLPLLSGREMSHWSQDTHSEVEVLSGCFWMARREAVKEVGYLDERFFIYAEDIDWCKRFWERGWKVVLVPTATASHFDGGSSANAPLRYSVEMLRANLTYWKKYRGVPGKMMCLLLYIIHFTVRLCLLSLKRALRRNRDEETEQKWRRSRVCLKWLVTGEKCPSERMPSDCS